MPLVYPARHSKDLRYVTGNFVFEIHVKKGEDGEIYETPEHKVSVVNITVAEVIRPTKICYLSIYFKYFKKIVDISFSINFHLAL